jgi:putative nucleotidyltransferase-like protein
VNYRLAEAILNPLRMSPAPVPQADGVWRTFDEKEWDRTLTWLDLSGLAVYFHQRLKMTGSLGDLPHHVRQRLDRSAADNTIRAAAIVEELRILCERFTSSGIRYAVLKGIALLPDYCPSPSLRTQYDHDVLVHPSSLEMAEEVLREAGYRQKNAKTDHPLLYCLPNPEIRFDETSTALYSSKLERSVEVHIRLWESEEDKIDIQLPGDLFERSVQRHWEGFAYVALSDEDCLVFQVLHAFRHILRNWCRLSIFLEISCFLNQRFSDSAFWARFADRIENIRWAPEATAIVFGLCEHLFGASIPPQIQPYLMTPLYPAMKLWNERYGRKSALTNFRNDKSSLFLYKEFVDDASAWSGIWHRRLFPVRRPHKPPAIVFQRGFSYSGRLWMEGLHAFRRLKFHSLSGIWYAFEYPRWMFLRRSSLERN